MSENMDNAIVHAKIVVGHNYKNPLNKDFEEVCSSDIMSREVKRPGDVLLPSCLNKLQVSDFCTQKLFLQQMSGLNKRIPKQIMSLEEKYLRHCLELIHMRANSMPSSKVNFDGFSSRVVGGGVSGCDALFLFSSGAENVVIRSSCMDPIVGSITGSTSMINLLTSPLLLRQLGASDDDDDVSYGNTSRIDVREPLISSFDGLSLGSSQDLQKKRLVPEDQIFGSHKRLVSFSDPTPCSSSSSSSSSSVYCQGMLHCSWNNGFPRYVFSVEDQREVYTTNLSKVKDEGLDYIYMFHCKAGKSENEIHDQESDVVGKMRVSTSFTVCPSGTQVMETEFSLCATGHHSIHTSNQTVRKNKGGISKKVANIFRGNHSYRQRSSSKFDGSFVVIQDKLLEASKEGNVSSFSSNLELAAIVVKDHIPCSQIQNKVHQVGGGWGLKFLKEDGHRKTNPSTTQTVPCHRCCTSSMDVLVPADFHGGSKTKSGGGPSSLVERWRSGGSCDCGGWDIGCPLTVLNAGPNNKDGLYQAGVFGKSNSFELFTKGCKQSMPVIQVKNVHDGLYYIQYQSTLSALQSLGVAVAIIHSHSPTLKPKTSI